MKFLVAIALLALAVAEATHVPEHTLRGPRFKSGHLYKYDVEFNMTAGVLGLSSQVSASVLQAEVSIYAKTDREHILKIENVLTSGSVMAIDNKYDDIPLHPNRELEDRLSSPIKFVLENGKITSYTLSHKENLESRKIKKSILRSLEMYIPENVIREMESPERADLPVLYNTTEDTRCGTHVTDYMIIVSPYVAFPSEDAVYNISRVDNYEGEWYPAHRFHHNFEGHGCPEVCRQESRDDDYTVGCPSGYEPHQGPIKKFFSHEQSLSPVKDRLAPEIISTVEVHYANMYDQNMEVLIRYLLNRTEVTEDKLEEETGQKTYNDLDDEEAEINEDEIDELCNYKKNDEAVQAADHLLEMISTIIVEGELGVKSTNLIGEKVILLKNVLTRFRMEDFKKLSMKIKNLKNLEFASDKESVQRQIWLDILPLVGTPESLKFIVRYIQEEIKTNNMLVWEAKEILEALPQNIESPDTETITEMKKLLQNSELLRKSPLLHSAVHLTFARVIGEVCGAIPTVRSPTKQKSTRFGRIEEAPRSKSKSHEPMCPESVVSGIVQEITRKLRATTKPEEIAIYIETLTLLGSYEALPVMYEYVYGTADNLEKFSDRFVDFTQSITLHALHNIVGKYPEEVLRIVLPVFFNETETPKVRNAAFGVLIRCQPGLDILEKVAVRSWTEESYEVGSYVTSTLETFGNSSLPCMQLVAERIQTVLPHVKRFDVGLQHAKNYMWTYFDDLREFGLEGRMEYTPNNESFIPSTMYHSLSYTIDSLRDIIFQNALNIEGLTQEKIFEKINKYLNIENIEPIEKEAEVFGEGKKGMDYIVPRTMEDLRFTTYNKLFYRSSYYYIDETILRSVAREFSAVFKAYLRKTESKYSGYLVKVYLPSTYHTVSIAKALPYPVEFQMRQPVVVALNIRTPSNTNTPPSMKHFELYMEPSVYMSKVFTHQIKNLGDCKEVGVYHEHKVAMTYPFELKYNARTFPNVTIKYKVPPKEKKVLTFFSECGTYAGKKELERLPSFIERESIRTLPAPFKFERDIHLVGVPPLHVELHTEDMNVFAEKLPRTPTEALDIVVRRVLNAGWRYMSVNMTILEDHNLWSGDTEATFKVEYSRRHIPRYTTPLSPPDRRVPQDQWNSDYDSRFSWQSQSGDYVDYAPEANQRSKQCDNCDDEDEWSKYLKPSKIGSLSEFTENARSTARILNYLLPHVSHVLNVSVTAEPLRSSAYFKMEFNHTYEKNLYSVHAEAASKRTQDQSSYDISIDHLMGYWNRPDEFKYDNHYGDQEAGFFTAINLPSVDEPTCPWEKTVIAMKGHMKYESNKEILEPELLYRVEDKYYLPETHEECMKDVRDGNPLSTDCLKAIREYSLFNKLDMHIMWDEALPKTMRQFIRVADIYMKHYFFEYMHLEAEENDEKEIRIKMDYIDKFVDEPVVDVEFRKPTETVTLRRVPVWDVRPLSSVYGLHETALMEMTNNTYPPTCVLSENYVQTYDMKEYEFTPKDCHYVLTTHCTENKNFAVVLHGNKELYIYVAAHTIILTPNGGRGTYTIKFNGRDYTLKDPILLHEKDEIYVYPEHFDNTHTHVRVIAKKAGIKVTYAEKNIKVEVSPRYKGEMCGLCSEFDGEELREFRGMDRCLYWDPVDFANSAMVKREGSCRVERLRDERMCDDDDNDDDSSKVRVRPAHRQEGKEPNTMRNIVITRGQDVCFSVRPVPVCPEGVEPTDTEEVSIGFHCLPKRDLTAKKMMNEAKWRVLEEIERKSVDYVRRMEVPKEC